MWAQLSDLSSKVNSAHHIIGSLRTDQNWVASVKFQLYSQITAHVVGLAIFAVPDSPSAIFSHRVVFSRLELPYVSKGEDVGGEGIESHVNTIVPDFGDEPERVEEVNQPGLKDNIKKRYQHEGKIRHRPCPPRMTKQELPNHSVAKEDNDGCGRSNQDEPEPLLTERLLLTEV